MFDPVSSLLQKLTSRQVEDLIFQHDLTSKGYKFHYAIDNHDIVKYCFPGNFEGDQFEMDESSGMINYDLENDIVTAYDEFYNGLTPSRPIFFLNEYIPELKDFRTQIEYRVDQGRLFNYVKDFNAYFESKVSDTGDIIQDFTLFISIATGFIQQGTHRFNSLMTNPYLIFRNEQFSAIEDGEALKKAFKESYSKETDLHRINLIFKSFINHSAKGNRFSKFTDSEALARIIRLNNCLLKSNKKILLLFLSTSDVTKKVSRDVTVIEHFPRVEKRILNFHRTVEQLFVNRLLEDLDGDVKLERLQQCKEMIQNRERLDSTESSNSLNYLQQHVTESFKALRERYVNTNLARKEQFLKIEKLSQELDQVKTNMNFGRLKRLYANLQKLSEQYVTENQNINELKVVETAFKIGQTFMAAFRKAIYQLENNNPIQVSRGKDPIAGAGQHLPIVFLHKETTGANMLDQIAELYLDQFALLDNTSLHVSKLTNDIINLASNIYDSEFDAGSLEDKLILCLYLLILPDANMARKANNDFVEECLMHTYASRLCEPEQILYSDLLYLLSWVLRRNEKYLEAKAIANIGIDKYVHDARFYHSRFLINACLTMQQKSHEAEDYLQFLSDIHMAQEKYPSILSNKSDIIALNILATLLNSEIYTYALLAEQYIKDSAEKIAILKEIREVKLPRLKKLAGEKYMEYPEFLHTEAFLVYLESECAEDAEDKKTKLNIAIGILETAIGLGGRLANYDTKSYSELLSKLTRI